MGIIALNVTNRRKEAILGNVIGYRKAIFTHLTGLLPNIIPVTLLKSQLKQPGLGTGWSEKLGFVPGLTRVFRMALVRR